MFGYQGQIRAADQTNGYFPANLELITLIRQSCNNLFNGYVERLGIEAPEKTMIKINNQSIEIGKTGLYEVNNAHITSLQFVNNSTQDAIIDFII